MPGRFFCVTLLSLCAAAESSGQSPADLEFFEKKIRPLFVEHCFSCHGGEKKVKGGLNMTSRAALLEGGDTGPALVPGEPDRSLVVRGVRYASDELKMPPKGKLKESEIRDLETWVKSGAAWPGAGPAPVQKDKGALFTEEQKQFWAFQPVREPPVPDAGTRSPIDSLVVRKLREKGLERSPPTDRRTLIRRVTFDLTGLPPTPEEVRAFLDDSSPDAFEQVVDRLLASPRYGERWARHWLDVARYADSNGLDENTVFANAFRYRDYVIRSLNQDKPYDRFVLEQVAGDLLPDAKTNPDCYTATGFLVLGPKILAEPDKQKMKLDIADEQVDTLGKVFMGLTLGCARCHDHKFDPLPTRDYYGLLGIFTSTRTMQNLSTVAKSFERPLPETSPPQMVLSVDEGAKYPEVKADGLPRNLFVQVRGNYLTPGEEAPAIFPRIIAGEEQVPVGTSEGGTKPNAEPPQPNQTRYGASRPRSGRLELARWLADPKHPLTARVMVNRVWRHHFGEGLVRTPDNFGKLGERPTHPELLDHLALRFVEDGWSLKRLHKRILMSETYQQSARHDPKAAAADPDNRLLWRFNRNRLEAEAIRDAMLFTAGNLDPTMGGTLLEDKDFAYVNSGRIKYAETRRSVYLPVVRNVVYDFFQVFDFVEPSVSNGKRASTVIAPQALFLMNSPFAIRQGELLAQSLLKSGDSDVERIGLAFEKLFSRPPREEEIRDGIEYVNRYESLLQSRESRPEKRRAMAWASYCQALYASSEFVFVN